MSESSTENTSHALPAPSDVPDKGDETTTIRMTDKVKLDELGPLVVNTDGTLSRIANWKNMSPEEQERTMRVLGARNKLRMANEEAKEKEANATAYANVKVKHF